MEEYVEVYIFDLFSYFITPGKMYKPYQKLLERKQKFR